MNYQKVSGSFIIRGGALHIRSLHLEEKEIIDLNTQLLILKIVVDRAVESFEKDFQKQFIPTKDTNYILPKDSEDICPPLTYNRDKMG